jgi:hypothetical protein
MATTVTLKPNAIDLSGSTSGTTTLQATAVAGTTVLTLPAATDTLVGKATTDTLTNKTLTSPTLASANITTALTLTSAAGTSGQLLTSAGSGNAPTWTNLSQIQPISASIATNAITISTSALSLDFRSTTLTSGTITTVSGTPSSLTIASTDSFGLVTAYGNQRIVILAINNAGTIELAASAIYGGVLLDETGVITTATTATTAAAIKATNVRTGVAYRVIGYIDATFTTATGWGSLVEVQGYGGQALNAMSSLGYGQTWQDMTASRAASTTYYNTTGKPIMVNVWGSSGESRSATLVIGGVSVAFTAFNGAGGGTATLSGIVPSGTSYVVSPGGAWSVSGWAELR